MFKKKSLKGYVREYGSRPKRSLGQVFLIERAVQEKIIELAELDYNDTVIEIGPGTGALTRNLLPITKRLIALEIDPALISYLHDSLGSPPNFHLICINALHFDYKRTALILKTPIKIVGNLPYVISTPLLFTFLEAPKAFSLLILMVQKEVAQRLTASPGTKEYGAMTIICRYYFDIHMELQVSRHCFHPVPKVDSAVIRCVPKIEEPFSELDEKTFRMVVKAAFSKRRKTIFNALRLSGQLNFPGAVLRDILAQCSIDSKRRPETLSLEEFSRLAFFIQNNQKKND